MIRIEYLVALASSFPFLPILWGEFVFDDWESIVNNPVVNGKVEISEVLWRDFWGRSLSSPQSHKSYRPLTTLFFRLQWWLFTSTPQLFHLVGLFLHACVSLLVLSLFRRLEVHFHLKTTISTIASFVFALHPVHTEVVANITCQCELLSTFFLLVTLKFYLVHCQKFSFSRLLLVLFGSMAALLSKEQGIVLLPICGVLSIFLKRKSHFWIFFLSSGLLALGRMKIGGDAPKFSSLDNPAAFVEPLTLRWFSFSWQWLLHLKLLLAPLQFCFDYSMGCVIPISSYSDPRVLLIPIIFLLITGGLFKFYRNLDKEQQRIFLFVTLFGAIAFFPASNILVTVGFSVAERILYLPSIGFSLLFAIGWRSLEKIQGKMESYAWLLTSLTVVVCFQRSCEWTTELSLYSSGLKVCPSNAKIHYNLAKILADQGQIAEAEKEYREAVRLHPHYEQALNNLGNLLEKKGHFNESEQFLRAAVSTRPQFAVAWMNLGITMMNAGKFNESIFAYGESLKHRPNSADCYFNLGNLYQKIGELEKAVEAWRNAVSLNPSHCPAWTNLFVALDELGHCPTVVSQESASMSYCSLTPALRSQLGVCHAQLRHLPQAEIHLLTAISLAPKNQVYRSNYDVFIQLKLKNYQERT